MNYENSDLEQEFRIYADIYRDNLTMADAFRMLTAGKAALDGVKTLNQYADDIKDVQKRGEFMRVIGELSIELAEVQIRLANELREKAELAEEISNLKKEIESWKNPNLKPVVMQGLYYINNDGPFCTYCYDSKKLQIRLAEVPVRVHGLGKYKCPGCSNFYKGE